MARYRQLMIEGETGWHLMSPRNPWEALRIAWMLWRHPDKVAALVGVNQEYFLAHCKPIGAPIAEEKYEDALRLSEQAERWRREVENMKVRYARLSIVTEEQRAACPQALYMAGDTVLVWANEGDLFLRGTCVA